MRKEKPNISGFHLQKEGGHVKSKAEQIKSYMQYLKIRTEIKQLQTENTHLHDEIKIEYRENAHTNRKLLDQLSQIQQKGNMYTYNIEQETKKNVIFLFPPNFQIELNNRIKHLKEQILQKKKQSTTDNSDDLDTIKKKIKTQEHRQQKILQKHNQASSQIKRLKEEVNLVRRERVIYDSVFKKFEYDLYQKQQEMMKFLKESVQIDQERDEILAELEKIRNTTQEHKQNLLGEYESVFHEKQIEFQQDSILNTQTDLTLENTQHFVTQPSYNKKASTMTFVMQQKDMDREIQQFGLIFDRLKVSANMKDIDQFIEECQNQEQQEKQLKKDSHQNDIRIEDLERSIADLKIKLIDIKNEQQLAKEDPQVKQRQLINYLFSGITDKTNVVERENQILKEQFKKCLVILQFKNFIPQLYEELKIHDRYNDDTKNEIEVIIKDVSTIHEHIFEEDIRNNSQQQFTQNNIQFEYKSPQNMSPKKQSSYKLEDILDQGNEIKLAIKSTDQDKILSQREIKDTCNENLKSQGTKKKNSTFHKYKK